MKSPSIVRLSTHVSRVAIALNLLLLSGGVSFADEAFDKLRASFSELREGTFSAQKDFDAKYEGQLDALMAKAQESANLDLAIEIREEKARFRTENPDAAATRKTKAPQLAKIREVYVAQSAKLREERARNSEPVYESYLKNLTEYRTASTKAGRLEDAVKADEEIKKIEKERLAFRAASAATPSSTKASAAASDDPVAAVKADIIGEWQYPNNGRTYRRIFTADGKVELWLEGSRDGAYLSELNWKAEKRGILIGAWVYKGDKEVARLKLSDASKSLKWDAGPDMVKVLPADLWKKR